MLELSLHGQSLESNSLSAALLDRESPMLKWLSTYLPRSQPFPDMVLSDHHPRHR